MRHGLLQRRGGRLQGRLQLGLLLADAGGLALHVLRVAAPALLGGRRGGVLHPLVRQADGAAHPFGELGEFVPGLLGPLQPRAERAHLLLQVRLAAQSLFQLGLRRLLALLQLGLVRDFRTQGLAQPHQVVGQQPQPGIAQVGLDDLGLARDRRLAAQRLELAAQFVGEVLDAGEVGLHRVQLAQRLLLALAVLEDSRPPPR